MQKDTVEGLAGLALFGIVMLSALVISVGRVALLVYVGVWALRATGVIPQ